MSASSKHLLFSVCVGSFSLLEAVKNSAQGARPADHGSDHVSDTATADTGTDAPDPSSDEDGDGYTAEDGDCDDNNSGVHPGAEEVCKDQDDDYDDEVDEGLAVVWYADRDLDGFGDVADSVTTCDPPANDGSAGHTALSTIAPECFRI